MLILVTYDVNITSLHGRRRLTKIAKVCCDYGQRVQNSVFECNVDNAQYVLMKNKLVDIMDQDKDSLRIYQLGNSYSSKIEIFGRNTAFDLDDALIL